MKYIGLFTTVDNGSVKLIYPDGQVAIANDKGKLAVFTAGKTEGMQVDTIRVFTDLEAAVQWVTEK